MELIYFIGVCNTVATFSERLKELRTSQGLSQRLLAEKAGIGRMSVQCYELESRRPTADAVITLANYFGVSTDYLLGLTNNPKRLE